LIGGTTQTLFTQLNSTGSALTKLTNDIAVTTPTFMMAGNLISPATGMTPGILPANIMTSSNVAHTIGVEQMNFTGTPDNTTFPRGDGLWSTGNAGDVVTIGTQTLSGINTFTNTGNTYKGEQIIKGWVVFTGTGTVSINDSYNVTSITDVEAGSYNVVWDVDFANANYCVGGLAGASDSVVFISILSIATTGINIVVRNNAGTRTDVSVVTVLAIGDQ